MHAFSCKTLRTTVIISCTIKNPSSSQLSIHYTCDKNEMVVNIPVFFFQFLIQTKKISMMCICSIRLPPLGIFDYAILGILKYVYLLLIIIG